MLRAGVQRATAAVTRSGRRSISTSEGATRLIENQKKFQQNPHLHGADNPTYLKAGPADYAVNAVGGILVTTAMLKFANGLYHMSFGTNILEIE